ncbi:hypothetical protein LCGC14_0316120 [marine sediment metagenome]|uniref:Uncharacterized protein n=1 Tax=marine sediment metagenome TaxID=412755 RepID=A0A0F9TKD5_9ZZZZ
MADGLISESVHRNLYIHLNIVSPVPGTYCHETDMCAPALRYYVNWQESTADVRVGNAPRRTVDVQ